jgi:zinc protease
MPFTRPGVVGLGLVCAIPMTRFTSLRAAEPPPSGTRKPRVPIREVEQYSLKNGLTVILHEDHKTPLVSLNVVYKVGSKDDLPGRTDFAN